MKGRKASTIPATKNLFYLYERPRTPEGLSKGNTELHLPDQQFLLYSERTGYQHSGVELTARRTPIFRLGYYPEYA